MSRVIATGAGGNREVHLNSRERERMAVDTAYRQEQERGSRMTYQKSHRKTKRGRMVPILPNFDAEQNAWDDLYSEAVECLDKITAAETRDAQIARGSREVSSARFPILGGQ